MLNRPCGEEALDSVTNSKFKSAKELERRIRKTKLCAQPAIVFSNENIMLRISEDEKKKIHEIIK